MILITPRKIVFSLLAPAAVLAAITTVAGISLHKNAAPPGPAAIVEPAPVTASEYENAVRQAFSGMKKDDAAAAIAVRDALLELHVPSQEKDAQLILVSKLTVYADALKSGKDAEGALNDLIAAVRTYPWLSGVLLF